MWKPILSWRSSSSRRRRGKANRTRRLSLERLEVRSVLSATFGSALSIGGNGSDGAFDMTADAAGYSYVTGDFAGTVDFDLSRAHPGDADILTARGSRDAYLAKYAPDDSLMWVRRMGGDAVSEYGSDTGRSVSLDTAGNVYVVGVFLETADFGSTTLVSAGGTDAFVAKFDVNGTFRWANRWGTAASDTPMGSGVDASGNVYGLTHTYDRGYEIVKFKSNGSQAWSKLVVAAPGVNGDMAVSPSGNVYVVGSFQGTADFDPSSKVKSVSSGTGHASFVLNLDTNGNFKWVSPFVGRTVGSTWGSAFAESVTLDNSGNVYVGGAYHGTVDFNPGSGTTTLDPTPGAFIAKLNSTGGLTWARAFQSGPGSYVWSIDTDALGNVYAAGSFRTSIDLNPGSAIDARTSNGDADIFVTKLTSAGNYVWGETFGGSAADYAFGIDVDASGYVQLAGYFSDAVDFDPSPIGTHMLGTPGGSRNGFRLRLRQS